MPGWYHEDVSTFTLSTAGELAELAGLVNGGISLAGDTVRLSADILLNDTTGWRQWKDAEHGLTAWTPIGRKKETPFRGTFDGCGHAVAGMYLQKDREFNVGLFGVVDGGAILNTSLLASSVTGYNFVGGIAGYLSGETRVAGCRNGGKVHSVRNSAGGIVGASRRWNEIHDCCNAGEVSGGSYVGGIVGHFENGAFYNCCNTGDISCLYDTAGGLLGHVNDFGYSRGNRPDVVANCYNVGSITGPYRLGGLAGSVRLLENSILKDFFANCYSTGRLHNQAPVITDGLVGNYGFAHDDRSSGHGGGLPKMIDEYFKRASYWADSCCRVSEDKFGYDPRIDTDTLWKTLQRDLTPRKFERMRDGDMKSGAFLRKLNAWVEQKASAKKTRRYREWREDVRLINHGYPVFKP